MRTVSAKSLCVLFGFLVPCLGTTTRAEAGVIPWLYNSIFGHGWGGGYGGGYGGAVPYTSGYGGYGYGRGCGCGTGDSAPMYSAPVYSAPAMSAPVAPVDGTYNAHYGPTLGYYDYGYGYGSSYVVNSGSCCTPCSACSTGDCATSIQSSKPTPQPTLAVPVTPKKKKDPTIDDFSGTRPGVGPGNQEPVGGEALPDTERLPIRRPVDNSVEPFVPPAEAVPPVEEAPPAGTLMQVVPADHNIAVRYVPTPQRSVVAIPRSTARVVRIDRATREQLTRAEPKPQLASNP